MPLVTLAQDIETGDLAAGPEGLRLAVGADAYIVLATNALRERPGDDPVEPWRGIPHDTLLGKRPTPVALAGLYARRLASVPGTRAVVSVRAEVQGETVRVDAVIRTTEGDAAVSAVIT